MASSAVNPGNSVENGVNSEKIELTPEKITEITLQRMEKRDKSLATAYKWYLTCAEIEGTAHQMLSEARNSGKCGDADISLFEKLALAAQLQTARAWCIFTAVDDQVRRGRR